MKESTLYMVLEALDSEIYMTKRVLRKKTRLSCCYVEEAIARLIEDDKVDRIYVKNGMSNGSSEAAYIRLDE